MQDIHGKFIKSFKCEIVCKMSITRNHWKILCWWHRKLQLKKTWLL